MEGLNCCQICYASELNPKTIKELRCKHTLCRTCFLRLVKKECPFCRAPFGTKKEIICGESILTQYYIENSFLARCNFYKLLKITSCGELIEVE